MGGRPGRATRNGARPARRNLRSAHRGGHRRSGRQHHLPARRPQHPRSGVGQTGQGPVGGHLLDTRRRQDHPAPAQNAGRRVQPEQHGRRRRPVGARRRAVPGVERDGACRHPPAVEIENGERAGLHHVERLGPADRRQGHQKPAQRRCSRRRRGGRFGPGPADNPRRRRGRRQLESVRDGQSRRRRRSDPFRVDERRRVRHVARPVPAFRTGVRFLPPAVRA